MVGRGPFNREGDLSQRGLSNIRLTKIFEHTVSFASGVAEWFEM